MQREGGLGDPPVMSIAPVSPTATPAAAAAAQPARYPGVPQVAKSSFPGPPTVVEISPEAKHLYKARRFWNLHAHGISLDLCVPSISAIHHAQPVPYIVVREVVDLLP